MKAWCFETVECPDGKVEFGKSVNLPFAPFVGLMILWDESEADFFIVGHVEWSVENECFWLTGNDESEVEKEEIIAWRLSLGWTLERR